METLTRPEPTESDRQAVVVRAATQISNAPVTRRPTKDAELDKLLGGGFAIPSWAGVWGLAGSGKTRNSLRWTTRMGRVLWCSLEMGEQLVRDTCESAGGVLDNLFVCERILPDQLTQAARDCGARIIGFDSISELPSEHWLELLDVLKQWVAEGPRFALVICHETKDGNYRGPSTFGHAPDYLLRTEPHPPNECEITVRKSRFCAQGSAVCPLVNNGNAGASDTRKKDDDEKPANPETAPTLALSVPVRGRSKRVVKS